ncbi:hypothetical protein GIB67_024701 [Kingdonia uniflora]|uniref:Uncharacterized protein n=1 Tax=Kingdonia uniflora TaxID=39325 RepID=A0A7J7N9N0_9MAGN|nr:hypothetical protein GIB67_024701 [Kingdonia uniflora]
MATPIAMASKLSTFSFNSNIQGKCRVFARFWFLTSNKLSPSTAMLDLKSQRFCSTIENNGANAYDIADAPDSHNSSLGPYGSVENNESQQPKAFSSNELMKSLRRYGISGILSYGLLNTVYYITTFLLFWFYVAPAPGRMGYTAAVGRFLKIMAMVWAGSQVTKLVRAGGALALAPFVDRGLSWITVKFKFKSQTNVCLYGYRWSMFWAGPCTVFWDHIALGLADSAFVPLI